MHNRSLCYCVFKETKRPYPQKTVNTSDRYWKSKNVSQTEGSRGRACTCRQNGLWGDFGVYRNIQAFSLTRDYRDVKSLVGRSLRLVFALPTLSADSVRECFLTTLTDLMPDTTEANLFADYIYGTYLHQDCSYPSIMWAAILCRNVKTTNACEAFHRHFQSSLQTYHLNIFRFMEALKVEQNRTSLKQRTEGTLPKRKKYASKEEQRASVAEKYKHGENDIVRYLFKMSNMMQPARVWKFFKAFLINFYRLV